MTDQNESKGKLENKVNVKVALSWGLPGWREPFLRSVSRPIRQTSTFGAGWGSGCFISSRSRSYWAANWARRRRKLFAL